MEEEGLDFKDASRRVADVLLTLPGLNKTSPVVHEGTGRKKERAPFAPERLSVVEIDESGEVRADRRWKMRFPRTSRVDPKLREIVAKALRETHRRSKSPAK